MARQGRADDSFTRNYLPDNAEFLVRLTPSPNIPRDVHAIEWLSFKAKVLPDEEFAVEVRTSEPTVIEPADDFLRDAKILYEGSLVDGAGILQTMRYDRADLEIIETVARSDNKWQYDPERQLYTPTQRHPRRE